jgi:hypothetical protein
MTWRERVLDRRMFGAIRTRLTAAQYIEIGMATAFPLLLLCTLLRPNSLSVNYGLSYFGVFLSTIVPYALAFCAYAFCLWKASESEFIKIKQPTIVRWFLRIMVIQIIGLLLTPYTRFYNIHVFFGAGLFSLQLLLSLLCIIWSSLDLLNVSLLLIEFGSGLAALYYLPRATGLLLQVQVVFQLAFGLLLVRVLKADSKS